jgi:coenzyme F420-reducing hydrogenase gamma subunit
MKNPNKSSKALKTKNQKPRTKNAIAPPTVGFYGVSGCAGCLLTVLFEDCFKELVDLVDIKSFPFIKEETYKGKLDYIFIEGTVCFDKDIVTVNELRKRAKKIVALGTCSCFGCVPSIRNFHDNKKTMNFVYPKYNHLKPVAPTPIDAHIKVDYYLPQCPPDKKEILNFIKCILTKQEFRPYTNPVCFECRKKQNPCLLEENKICLGPITTGGCGALCPSNSTVCYGCRGPSKDANYEAFLAMLKKMGHTNKEIKDKLETFAGLAVASEQGEKSLWLEK